jgi:hypothetical protein
VNRHLQLVEYRSDPADGLVQTRRQLLQFPDESVLHHEAAECSLSLHDTLGNEVEIRQGLLQVAFGIPQIMGDHGKGIDGARGILDYRHHLVAQLRENLIDRHRCCLIGACVQDSIVRVQRLPSALRDLEKGVARDPEALLDGHLGIATHEIRHPGVDVDLGVYALIGLNDDVTHLSRVRAEHLHIGAPGEAVQSLRGHDHTNIHAGIQPFVDASADKERQDEEDQRRQDERAHDLARITVQCRGTCHQRLATSINSLPAMR